MAQKYDLSSALDNDAQENLPKRKKKKVGVIAAVIIGAVVLGGVGIGTANYFARDNFSSNIPLSHNITRWTTGLEWYYGSSQTKVTNTFGTWTRTKPNTPFRNSATGCVFNPFVVSGNGGANKNDLDSSKAYEALFIKGQETTQQTKEAAVPIEGNSGTIGVLKTSYKAANGDSAIAYYRYMSSNDTIRVLVVSCTSPTELTKIAPYSGNGSELTKLGIALKPTS